MNMLKTGRMGKLGCGCEQNVDPSTMMGLRGLSADPGVEIAESVAQGYLGICPDKDVDAVPYATILNIAAAQYFVQGQDLGKTKTATIKAVCDMAKPKFTATGTNTGTGTTPAVKESSLIGNSTTAYWVGGILIAGTLYYLYTSKNKKGKNIDVKPRARKSK